MFRAVAVLAATGMVALAGCTKVDDTLGSNLVPDNQQMKAGFTSVDGTDRAKQYIETRLYQTDSIRASNITYGYFGSSFDRTFGQRTAGFLTQYISYYLVDEGYFGVNPIFDSVQILLSINSYGQDTTTVQTFNVYEVTSNDYLTQKPIAPGKSQRDTLFYLNFDPIAVGAVKADAPVLFSFKLGGDQGPATKAVTMDVTPAGEQFIRKLMLQKPTTEPDFPYVDDYSIYSTDSLKYWVEEFKGIYIKPAPGTEPTTPGANDAVNGTVYSMELDASGFGVYGRTRVKDDPTLIKDTIGMVYYFYDSYAEYGNVSVNDIKYKYDGTIRQADAAETNTSRPENAAVYVAGMGGVVSEITFDNDFFEKLEDELAAENTKNDKEFKTLAFSQAKMSIYFPASVYNWEHITQIDKLFEQMDAAQNRLGLYTNYKKLTPITDYAYAYEKTYDTELTYGGYINRSRGCYVMDITGYLQQLWNGYVKLRKETPEGQQVDLTKLENRTVYLAPEAYDLYAIPYTTAQGMAGDVNGTTNDAPIRFDLTYNMIK